MPGEDKIEYHIGNVTIFLQKLVINGHEINTSGVQEFSEPMGLVIHATGGKYYTGYSAITENPVTIKNMNSSFSPTTFVYFNGVDITNRFKEAALPADAVLRSQSDVSTGGHSVEGNNALMKHRLWNPRKVIEKESAGVVNDNSGQQPPVSSIARPPASPEPRLSPPPSTRVVTVQGTVVSQKTVSPDQAALFAAPAQKKAGVLNQSASSTHQRVVKGNSVRGTVVASQQTFSPDQKSINDELKRREAADRQSAQLATARVVMSSSTNTRQQGTILDPRLQAALGNGGQSNTGIAPQSSTLNKLDAQKIAARPQSSVYPTMRAGPSTSTTYGSTAAANPTPNGTPNGGASNDAQEPFRQQFLKAHARRYAAEKNEFGGLGWVVRNSHVDPNARLSELFNNGKTNTNTRSHAVMKQLGWLDPRGNLTEKGREVQAAFQDANPSNTLSNPTPPSGRPGF